jgi:hypothetical protein
MRHFVVEKQEDEVKIATMESRLRKMVVDLVSPTVQKSVKLQTHLDQLKESYDQQEKSLFQLELEMKNFQERSDLVRGFQAKLDRFNTSLGELEIRLSYQAKEVNGRLDNLDKNQKLYKEIVERTNRDLERTNKDVQSVEKDIKETRAFCHDDVDRVRDKSSAEVRRLDEAILEARKLTDNLRDEVWGPDGISLDELERHYPPSLRRLDMQARRTKEEIQRLTAETQHLQGLEQEMKAVGERQVNLQQVVASHFDTQCQLKAQVEQEKLEHQKEQRHLANTVSAFSANLMHDLRCKFTEEVKQLRSLLKEAEVFLKENKAGVEHLQFTVETSGRQVEAFLHESRADLDGLEMQRRRDKQNFQELVEGLCDRFKACRETSEASLRGLDFLTGVVGLSLQSERMSVALDVQDFLERKDTPYVGIQNGERWLKGSTPKPTNVGVSPKRRCGDVDPASLVRLAYQPQPVSFQGSAWERSKLLALREQMVHAAQEVLMQGPKEKGARDAMVKGFSGGKDGATSDLHGGVAPPIVPEALGTAAVTPLDLLQHGHGAAATAGTRFGETGRRSTTPNGTARPGSRGQPSARGSTTPDGEAAAARGNSGTPLQQLREDRESTPTEFLVGVEQATPLASARLSSTSPTLPALPTPLTAR